MSAALVTQDPRPAPSQIPLHQSDRSAWRAGWDKDPTLTPTQLRVLEMLRRRLNKANVCWPSQKVIAQDSNISERSARRALKALDRRWITRTRRYSAKTGNRTSDLIQICFPQQELPNLRNLNPDHFDMPTTHRPQVERGGSEADHDGSFFVPREGGLPDKVASGLPVKVAKKPSVQKEPQDRDLQAALCRSMQAPRSGAGAAGERLVGESGQGIGHKAQKKGQQASQQASRPSPEGFGGQPAARCSDVSQGASVEPEAAHVCELWSDLLQDPEHEQECGYRFRRLQVSMVQGYSGKVLLTALAMLLDKLAHRRRDLRPIGDICAYYGSLIHVADQNPERTGGGQEWECRPWSREQLEQIKQGQRPYHVLAGSGRPIGLRAPEVISSLAEPEAPALVMPGLGLRPEASLEEVAGLVRQLHRANPGAVAQSLLAHIGGDLEHLAAAWLQAGGPADARAVLEAAQMQRRAMGL